MSWWRAVFNLTDKCDSSQSQPQKLLSTINGDERRVACLTRYWGEVIVSCSVLNRTFIIPTLRLKDKEKEEEERNRGVNNRKKGSEMPTSEYDSQFWWSRSCLYSCTAYNGFAQDGTCQQSIIAQGGVYLSAISLLNCGLLLDLGIAHAYACTTLKPKSLLMSSLSLCRQGWCCVTSKCAFSSLVDSCF